MIQIKILEIFKLGLDEGLDSFEQQKTYIWYFHAKGYSGGVTPKL